MGPSGASETAGAGATIEVLRFLHAEVQDRLLPRVREEYDAFEALTLDAIAKMKEEDELQLAKRKQQQQKPKKRLLSSASSSSNHSSVPSAPPTLNARQKELCRRWFARFVAMNDWLIHARTGLTRHSYQQHHPPSSQQQQQQAPKGIVRYCDLDARHRLCNYKGDATAYATSCLDNALAAARLVLAAGGKKHRAVAEALDASLCECDNRLQETATKVVGLVDRFKLSLPLPLRLDRNHGSESLEGVIVFRGCLQPPSKKNKGKALAKGKGKDKEREGGREGGEGEPANSAVCTCSAAQEGRWWLDLPSLSSGSSSQEAKVYNIGFAPALSDMEDNNELEGRGEDEDEEGEGGREGGGRKELVYVSVEEHMRRKAQEGEDPLERRLREEQEAAAAFVELERAPSSLSLSASGRDDGGGVDGVGEGFTSNSTSSRERRAVGPRSFLAQYHKRTYRLFHEDPSSSPSLPPSSTISVSSLLFRLALQVLQDTHQTHHLTGTATADNAEGGEWPCFTYLRVERGTNAGEGGREGGKGSSSSSNERFAPGQALDVREMEPGKAIRLHLGVDPSRCVKPVPPFLLRYLDECQNRALPPNPAMVASLVVLPEVKDGKEGGEEEVEGGFYVAPALATDKDLEVLCAALEGVAKAAAAADMQEEEEGGEDGGRAGEEAPSGRRSRMVVVDDEDEERGELPGVPLPTLPATATMPTALDLSFHPLTSEALASLSAALPALARLRLQACSLTSLPTMTATSAAARLCELDLSYNSFVPSPTFSSSIADLLALPSLTRIILDGVPSFVAEPLAHAFERRRTVAAPALTRVSLCDNVWGPTAWKQVLRSMHSHALYAHDMTLCGEDEGERAEVMMEVESAEGWGSQSQQALGGKEGALEMLAARLQSGDSALERLALSCPSSGDPVEPLFRVLIRPSCTLAHLDLSSSSGPYLSLDAITDLFAALCHNTRLESLELSQATSFASFLFAEPCLRLLARALQTNPQKQLRVLSLRGCGLGLKGLAALLAALLPSSSSDGVVLSCAPFDSLDLADNVDAAGMALAKDRRHDEADIFTLSQTLPQLLPLAGPRLLATPGGKLELSGNGLVGLMNELGWRSSERLRGWMQTCEEYRDALFFVCKSDGGSNMEEAE